MSDFSEAEAEVLRLYRANPRRFSPFRASRVVGIPLAAVFELLEKVREKSHDVLSFSGERFDGLGRPELRAFAVARRQVTGEHWDNNDPNVSKARKDYEAGTHDMATGRDGRWLILYSIPRHGPAKPRPGYFNLAKSQ